MYNTYQLPIKMSIQYSLWISHCNYCLNVASTFYKIYLKSGCASPNCLCSSSVNPSNFSLLSSSPPASLLLFAILKNIKFKMDPPTNAIARYPKTIQSADRNHGASFDRYTFEDIIPFIFPQAMIAATATARLYTPSTLLFNHVILFATEE